MTDREKALERALRDMCSLVAGTSAVDEQPYRDALAALALPIGASEPQVAFSEPGEGAPVCACPSCVTAEPKPCEYCANKYPRTHGQHFVGGEWTTPCTEWRPPARTIVETKR